MNHIIIPWVFFFYKISFQNLTNIKISEYTDHRNVGSMNKDNKDNKSLVTDSRILLSP